ncbi:hypothetical protein [Spirosoma daeguense]
MQRHVSSDRWPRTGRSVDLSYAKGSVRKAAEELGIDSAELVNGDNEIAKLPRQLNHMRICQRQKNSKKLR